MPTESKVYLYSRWQGKFEVLEGHVEFSSYWRGHGRFIYYRHQKEKYVLCGFKEGVISNRVVWLTKRDDDLARKLFIEYEEGRISELEDEIKRRKQNIQALKDVK